MSDQTTETTGTRVFVRYQGWILDLEADENGRTNRDPRTGICATCYPNGMADIEGYDTRSGVKIYSGFGSWSDRRVEIPVGTRIHIRKGSRIQNAETFTWRTIDQSIKVYAVEDEENGEWVFPYEGKKYSIGYESADIC